MFSFKKWVNGVDGGGEGEYKYFCDANETKRERKNAIVEDAKTL